MINNFLENLQIETTEIILYAPNSLNYIIPEMIDKTLETLPIIYNFFGITSYRKFQINLFDNLIKFREFVLTMRENKNSLPEYARGTYDLGMINAFIENNIVKSSPLYNSKLYYVSHEIFHILYKELILKDNQAKRIVWLDEGLAQYLSGEKDYLLKTEKFQEFYINVKNNTKEYPNLNTIKHGNGFVNEKYNGYKLSYLCVKYLFDTKNIDEVREIVFDYKKSIEVGKTIVADMFEYYNQIIDTFSQQK